MRIVYLGAHSILESDEVALFHALGHDVFSIGSYIHPSRPDDPKREPLDVPEIPELIAAVDALGQQGHTDTLMAAKDMGLPDAVLDWAEVIVVSALEHRWLTPHLDRFKGKRVIWRTIGQSGDRNEEHMREARAKGCEVVRYSPKERNIPNYVGADAVIRFYKDPDEWRGWTGKDEVVTNVTQSMLLRHPWCNPQFWVEATEGLPVMPMGAGSEEIGGLGEVSLDRMKAGLRMSRAYLYTGTQPASYTLGLIEAMMTGIPVISIGPEWMRILPYGSELFEGHEITKISTNDPLKARSMLMDLLADRDAADRLGTLQRERAIELFGKETIFRQWAEFLDGSPSRRLVRAVNAKVAEINDGMKITVESAA